MHDIGTQSEMSFDQIRLNNIRSLFLECMGGNDGGVVRGLRRARTSLCKRRSKALSDTSNQADHP